MENLLLIIIAGGGAVVLIITIIIIIVCCKKCSHNKIVEVDKRESLASLQEMPIMPGNKEPFLNNNVKRSKRKTTN